MSNIEQALKAALAAIDLYDYTMTVEESEKFAKAERLCKSALSDIEKCYGKTPPVREPVGYGVQLPTGMYGNMYTMKHEAEEDFKNWKHKYPESKVIPLYTSPQPIEKCKPVAKVLFIQDEDGLEPHTFYSNDEAPAQEQLKDKFVIMDVYLVPQPNNPDGF